MLTMTMTKRCATLMGEASFNPLVRLCLVCFADGEGVDDDKSGGGGGEDKSAADKILEAGGSGGADAPKFGDFDTSVLPEGMRGETAEQTLEKLYGSWKGFRDKDATAEKAPEKSDGYTIELSDKAKEFFPDLENDDVYKMARDIAHGAGMPQSAFQSVIGGLMEKLGESGLLQPVIDPVKELEALSSDPKEAAKIATSVKDFQERLEANGKPEGMDTETWKGLMGEMELIRGTGRGIQLLNFFQSQMGEKGVTLTDTPGAGGAVTLEEATKRMRDPRYRTDNAQYDPAFRKETDNLMKQLTGAKAA
ncbi:MAG: hypothetical protein AAFY82_00140 [Pseudomonadota bacterium]